MDNHLLIFSSYELFLSFTFCITTVYFSLITINRMIIKARFFDLFLKEGNIAISIFEGTLILCVLILVSQSVRPAVDALRTMVLSTGEITWDMFRISLGYFFTFYLISLVFSYILLSVSFFAFIKATIHVDEIAEMKKNQNIAVAIVLSAVLLGVTLFIRPGFDNLIGSLIDYNFLENFNQNRSLE